MIAGDCQILLTAFHTGCWREKIVPQVEKNLTVGNPEK